MQEFVKGSLPNIMFIGGLIAIGLGLGIEFKIVEVKGQLTRGSRFGAISVGAILIAVSVFLYIRPLETASTPPAPAQPDVVQANLAPIGPVSQPLPETTEQPASAPVVVEQSQAAPTVSPPDVPAEQPQAAPTVSPPDVPVEPSQPLPAADVSSNTVASDVTVPDLRDMNVKEAEKLLRVLGLQLGQPYATCDQIQASGAAAVRVKKGHLVCQSALPSSLIPPGSTIDYVVFDDKPPRRP